PRVAFLCPVPGYDRHFSICEELGIEMIPVPLASGGPDMDAVEALVAKHDSIKGIWTVPKYSNPSGAVYSNETVDRLARMKTAAGVETLMDRHREILAPKFQKVLDVFEEQLGAMGAAAWTRPKGGYFITLEAPHGTAKHIVKLAKEAGVELTPAGSTHPLGL